MAFTTDYIPPDIALARNPMPVLLSADPNWSSYSDYYIRLRIEYQPNYFSGVYETIPGLIKGRVNAQGKVEFDIKAYVFAQTSRDMPAQTPLPDVEKYVETAVVGYRISLIEYIDGVQGQVYTSPRLLALRGGLHHTKTATGSFFQFQLEYPGKRFLSHAPLKRMVSPFQPLWASFIGPATGALLKLKITRLYENGASDSFTTGPYANFKHEIFRVPVGYTQLDLENGAANTIRSWKVELLIDDNPQPLAEVLEFELDCTHYPNERFYIFENAFGMLDSVRTTGRLETSQATESQQAAIAGNAFRQKQYHNLQQFNTTQYDRCIQSCGHLEEAEVYWIRDLLASENVWRLGNVKPNPSPTLDLWPIVIDRGSSPVRQDDDFLYTRRFSYRDAFVSTGI